jgi:protein-disulfide isomerase
MGMRSLVTAVLALSLLFTSVGCAAVIPGNAVAAKLDAAGGVPRTDDGHGIVLGTAQDGGAAAIDLFIEPQCPHCGHFVAEYGDAIAKDIAGNRLAVTIRPLTFMDNGSHDYSARATNAIFLIAADRAATPALVWKFIQGLYARLMSTASHADNDGIAKVANDVGVPADTVKRIAAAEPQVDGNLVSNGNLSVMDDYGVERATPTVYDTVGKDQVDFNDPQWLDHLVK